MCKPDNRPPKAAISAKNVPDSSSGLVHSFLMTANATLCVPMYGMFLGMGILCTSIYFSPIVLRCILMFYPVYCVLDKSPTSGIRWLSYERIEKFRSNRFYRWSAQFYPVELHKTVDLNPSQGPFIFLYHPHGVISMGANCALNTNGCDFNKAFPGIRRWGVTLNASFFAPIFRDWMLFLGIISANKQTLVKKLAKDKDSIVLVPGGAAEALHAHESNFRLHIRNRKGFIRLAIETGAKPIPCVGFGENEAFDTIYVVKKGSDSWLTKIMHKVQKFLSFSTPVMRHPFPRRRKIDVVVGKPVEFPAKAKDISDSEYVDACHDIYLDELKKLYNEHQAKLGHIDTPIEFI